MAKNKQQNKNAALNNAEFAEEVAAQNANNANRAANAANQNANK